MRAEYAAGQAVAASFGAKPVPLRLISPWFYHLDTALCILDDDTCLWVPNAFDTFGQQTIRSRFKTRFEVPMEEARMLAANAHAVGEHVLIERECVQTQDWIDANGFESVPLDTSEFRKSGGSVYCMKHAIP